MFPDQPTTHIIHADLDHAHGVAAKMAAGFLAGYQPATRTAYLGDLKDFASWCDQTSIDVMTADRASVNLFARHLQEERGLAPSSTARKLTAITGFYRYAVDEGAIRSSPAERVKRPRVGQDSPRLGLSRAAARRLLQAIATDNPASAALVHLLLLNGLRVSEACQANVEDLGESAGRPVLRITRKGGSSAEAPLAERTALAVRRAVGDRKSGPLLLNASGGRLCRQEAHRIIARLGRRLKLPGRLYPHLLRHTWVTTALDAGAPLQDVQDAAGHQDPKTTRRYDRARGLLEHHPTYAVAEYLS